MLVLVRVLELVLVLLIVLGLILVLVLVVVLVLLLVLVLVLDAPSASFSVSTVSFFPVISMGAMRWAATLKSIPNVGVSGDFFMLFFKRDFRPSSSSLISDMV